MKIRLIEGLLYIATHTHNYMINKVSNLFYGCANFAGIIFREIGLQKQRAKLWHNWSKFEQNALK